MRKITKHRPNMYSTNFLPQNVDDIVNFYRKYKEFFVEAMIQPQLFKRQVRESHPEFAHVNKAFANMINDSIDEYIKKQQFTASFGEAIIYKKQNAYHHAILGKASGEGIINDDYEMLKSFYQNKTYAKFFIENAYVINDAANDWYACYQANMVNENTAFLMVLLDVANHFFVLNEELNELPELIQTQLEGKYEGIINETDYTRFLIGAIQDVSSLLSEIQLTMSTTAYKECAEDIIASGFCRRVYLDVKEKKHAARAAREEKAKNAFNPCITPNAAKVAPFESRTVFKDESALDGKGPSNFGTSSCDKTHSYDEASLIDGFTIFESATAPKRFAEETLSPANDNKRTRTIKHQQ